MSQDLLERYTDLDREVRDAEKELSTFEAQLVSYKQREKELYEALGVSDLVEMESKLVTLRSEVEAGLLDWQIKVQKVNEVIRDVEQRIERR